MSLDALILRLSSKATATSPIRVGWLRRRGVVRGLTIDDLTALAARHPDARDTLWALFGLGGAIPTETSDADGAVLLDALATAIGARGTLTSLRLSRLPAPAFEALVRTVVDLTVPSDVDELFAPVGDVSATRSSNDIEDDGVWRDPVVVLDKLVIHLARKRFPGAGSWTPGRAFYVASVLAERDHAQARADLHDNAHAARAGQYTEQGFKAFLNGLRD